MIDKRSHLIMWDQLRKRHGITLRVLDQLPADKLTTHPIKGMRTPVELVVHMYTGVEQYATSVVTGTLGKFDEKTAVAGIKTKEQLLKFVNNAWLAADKKAQSVTDTLLGAKVRTSWGEPLQGSTMLGILYDEYLHHRGQLYAFVRMFGIEPVMVWDFEHNAPEFRSREPAQS